MHGGPEQGWDPGQSARGDAGPTRDAEGLDEEGVQKAREELGEALEELRTGIDEVLASARQRLEERDHAPVSSRSDVTPDVGGALWELVRRLPGVIGNSLSGDEERVGTARDTLTGLDARLGEAGMELGDHLTGYADRLAGLRDGAPGSGPDGRDTSRHGR